MTDRFDKQRRAGHAAVAQDKAARIMSYAVAAICFSLAAVAGIMALATWLAG